MSEQDRVRRAAGRVRAPATVWLSLLLIGAVAMSLAPSAAAGERSRHREVIVVQPANPASFSPPTEACPEGAGTLTVTGPTGRQAGTATTCIREATEMGPTAVTLRTTLTMSLRRGQIVLDLTIAERFFEVDPGLVFQDFDGTVEGGTGRYRNRSGRVFGGGSLRFNADGTLSPDAVFVVVLDRRR